MALQYVPKTDEVYKLTERTPGSIVDLAKGRAETTIDIAIDARRWYWRDLQGMKETIVTEGEEYVFHNRQNVEVARLVAKPLYQFYP